MTDTLLNIGLFALMVPAGVAAAIVFYYLVFGGSFGGKDDGPEA